MNGSGAKLVVEGGPSSQEEYELTTGANKIGREDFNDIIIYDPEVSRHHAQIIYHGGEYLVEDLGSTNGTFVNGRRITSPTSLSDGDIIELGASVKATFNCSSLPIDATVINVTTKDDLDPTFLETPETAKTLLDPTEKEPIFQPPDPQAATFKTPPPTTVAPPPARYSTGPHVIVAAEEENSAGQRRTLLILGCLFLVIVFACAAGLFLLDALAPEFLYCGPARPLSELIGLTCS